MIKKIFESTLIMGTSSAAVMAIDLVRVKILALLLGPQGIGVLSILSHFHQVAFALIGLGLGTGIVRYVATYQFEGARDKVTAVLKNCFQIVFLFSVFSCLLTIILRAYVSEWLIGDGRYAHFVVIYAISFPLAVFPSIVTSFLNGLKRIKALSKINIFRASVSLVIIIPLVYFFKLKGAVLSVLVTASVHWGFTAYYLGKENAVHRVFPWQPIDQPLMKKIFQYGMTSLLVGSAYYLSHLALKMIIVRSLGVSMNGIYQPVWALTMTYLTLVLSSMSTYSYPRLCELKTQKSINEELNGILRVSVLMIMPAMFFLILFRASIIELLYSRAFVRASDFMPIQILGDFFKLLCWSIGMYLLPTKRLYTFVGLNLFQDVSMLVFAFFLVDQYKLHGIAAAFALSYGLSFLGYYLCSTIQLQFRIEMANLKMVFFSLAALIVLWYCTLSFGWPIRALLAAGTISIWAVFSVKKTELVQVANYIRTKTGEMVYRK